MVLRTVQKTLKIKLIPVSKKDRALAERLLKEYTGLLTEALDIVVKNDARSVRRAHELCYRYLREKYSHLHNKYVEEAYKRALSMYKSYRRLLSKWTRGRRGEKPSPPIMERNRVVELHVDTFRIEEREGLRLLRVSVGGGEHARFLMVVYDYALRELAGSRVSNSKLLFEDRSMYLLLTIRKSVEVVERLNKLVVDVNEDNVACLLVDYENGRAVFFTVEHDVRRLRENYRRIRRSIQRKVDNVYERNRLLAKHGARERNRVADRVKKVATFIAEIARVHNAELVRERLKYMKARRTRNKRLNYRLQTLPYRRILESLDLKFQERGLNVVEVDARNTSVTCPRCGHIDKGNRATSDLFKCRKCGFEFNAHYVACLNLFSRLGDGSVAIRGGRVYVSHKAGFVVPADVAPNDPATSERVLREKPATVLPIVAQGIPRNLNNEHGNHWSLLSKTALY